MAKETVRITEPGRNIVRKVTLQGITPMLFDRYAGDNNTKLEAYQKLYFQPGGSKAIGLPALNIMSFLSAHNTNSAPKRLRDKRKYKDICNAILSFTTIGPEWIPLTREGEPIIFGKFGTTEPDLDNLSGIRVLYHVARLDKGIPNPKVRPMLPTPWELSFNLTIYDNKEIKEQEILNLFEEGGRAIGLGTFRGVFGKFIVSKWE